MVAAELGLAHGAGVLLQAQVVKVRVVHQRLLVAKGAGAGGEMATEGKCNRLMMSVVLLTHNKTMSTFIEVLNILSDLFLTEKLESQGIHYSIPGRAKLQTYIQ